MFDQTLSMPAQAFYMLILGDSDDRCELPQHERGIKQDEQYHHSKQESKNMCGLIHGLIAGLMRVPSSPLAGEYSGGVGK